MRSYKLGLLGLLLTGVVLLAVLDAGYAARLDDAEADAGSEAPDSGNKIQLNFRDVEILNVIRLMSELTGKNFLVDDNVRGKVTLIAPEPVGIDEAYQVFLSILEIQGFTVVPQGPVIKIIPSADIKDSPIPTATDGESGLAPTGSDAFVTQLIPLKFADVNQIRGLLSPLVSKESSLLSYAPTNTLILTETASNLARLKKIITVLDVKAPTKIFRVAPLQHADAGELASSLQTALQGLVETTAATDGQPPPDQAERRRRRRQRSGQPLQSAADGSTIIADTRTNSLVLIATPDSMEAAQDIITKLDIPTPAGRGKIHVYYLSHANAEELAQVLTAQAPEITRIQDAQADRQSQQPRQSRQPTTGKTPTDITITADKPTNSLVITADPETYAIIEGIIQKLDIRRSQVLVEGLIAEVSLDTARDLGVEWRVIDQPDGTQVFASAVGSDSTGALNPITADPTALLSTPGFLVGALRNTIRLDVGGSQQELLNIPVLLRAFQGNTNVEVLATPNLLTTDNEEAEIIVGEQRPFLTSVNRIPDAGIVNVSNTFDFRDTGITLRITPQISKGHTVRTELFLEITRFVSESEVGAVTTTKRSTKTTVIVDDGQTIVLGGLLQDSQNETNTSVPCLGSVPLFGFAFKQSGVQSNKTNLLIFLTPHIITTHDDIDRVTTHKQQQAHQPEVIEQKLLEGQPKDNLEWLLD